MKALTPTPLTYGAGLPAYLDTSSCRSESNRVNYLFTAHHRANVCNDFHASPWILGLAAALRRIELVILPTDSSLPLAVTPLRGDVDTLDSGVRGVLRH